MELRLQKYIESMGQLSDIRNLDPLNPTIFQLQHPVSATLYVTVAAIHEPSHLGLPINTTWTVLDPVSPYYRKALKLKGSASAIPDEGVTPLAGLQQQWIALSSYDEIFSDPQYYDMTGTPGPQGIQGPPGPAGPMGPPGPPAVVDIAAIVQAVLDALEAPVPQLRIEGPATLVETGTAQYSVKLVANGAVIPVQVQIGLTAGAHATIDAAGLLTASSVTADDHITLTATYDYNGTILNANLPVVILNATIVDITINGAPATILEGSSFNATCRATYTGAPASNITPQWSLEPPDIGTIDASGHFVAAQVAGDTTFVLKATYSEGGVDLMDAVNCKVINIIPTSVTVSGPASLFENLTAQYTAVGTANNGQSGAITPIWSVEPPSAGTINGSGLFTAAAVTADLPCQIVATYNIDGATLSGQKAVTVLNLAADALDVTGLSNIFEGLSTQFSASAHMTNGTTSVVTPIWSVVPSSAGSINSAGLFTAALVAADVPTTIHASFTSGGVTVTADKAVLVKNIVPTSLTLVSGATQLNEGATTQITATVHRNDGSSGVVTASYAATPTTGGSVSASGVFTAALVNADVSTAITGSYTESGVTVTSAALTILVKDVPVVLTPYFGAAATSAVKNQALILGLTQRGPTSDRLNSDMVIIDGPNLSMYYAYPVSYGLATFTDKSNGFQGGWDGAGGNGDGTTLGPITVQVNGVPYYLYKTDQSNISPLSNPTHWAVS